MTLAEARVVGVLALALLIPGWTLLTLTQTWRVWRGLERWVVAVGLSLAAYPLLFYTLRWLLPGLTLGPYKLTALLGLGLAITLWQLRGHWRSQLRLRWHEWVALALLALTLWTRGAVALTYPYPAWSDSLHHVLLTHLTAVQGQLPTTLDPYFPIPLAMYHMGLHGLAAVVMWLAQVPAHTALLWTAQALNGLAGLGVYLVLRRAGSPVGALVGLALVGLWSHQPAFYVNWGRFTQLSSQVLLLIAWCVVMITAQQWARPQRHLGPHPRPRWARWAWALLAAGMSAAVFLLHFRVAAFYLPLVALGLLAQFWQLRRQRARLVGTLWGMGVTGAAALVWVLPVLLPALTAHLASYANLATQTVADAAEVADVMAGYFAFDWANVTILAGDWWLLILGGVAAAIGLVAGNRVTWVAVGWLAVLLGLGYTYVLGISPFNVTNIGAVLILAYLPLGLAVGATAQTLLRWTPAQGRRVVTGSVAALVIALSLYHAPARITAIEPHRHFMTAADARAMDWIRANLPEEARFAVNAHVWLVTTPHGTDGGYWIPYFTGRQMTATVMVLSLGDYAYQAAVLDDARAVKRLETDLAAVDDLLARGIEYVYIGVRGNFDGTGLDPAWLRQSPQIAPLYAADGVSIFRLLPGP